MPYAFYRDTVNKLNATESARLLKVFIDLAFYWIRIDTKTDEKGCFKLEVDRDKFPQDICIAIIYKEPGSDSGRHLPLINKEGKPLELKMDLETKELDLGKVKMKKK